MAPSMTKPQIRMVDAVVRVTDHLCRDHVVLELAVEGFPTSHPGQFLEIRCSRDVSDTEHIADWPDGAFPSLSQCVPSARAPYLRRPFSIADRYHTGAGEDRLVILSRKIGPGTDFLDRLAPGDVLNVSGPLGRPFRLPTNRQPLLLVGGGVGIPPLLYVARTVASIPTPGTIAIFGATSADYLPLRLASRPDDAGRPTRCVRLPADSPIDVVITTDDGTCGVRGRVTDAMERLAAEQPLAGRPLVLACGPDGMLHAVARLTRRLGWDCQLCIEKNMGCGLGTCLSCVARVVDSTRPGGWRWALTCSEGPVFDRDCLVEYG